MNILSVRQAVLSDLDALVPLLDNYRQFYGKVSDPSAARSFLSDRFNHGESVLFIAEIGAGSQSKNIENAPTRAGKMIFKKDWPSCRI